MSKIKLITLLLCICMGSTLFATAGGGTYYGYYQPHDDLSNINLEDLYYYGGYGYGTDWEGIRSGGFGMVIFSESEDADLFQGAYGGVITGKEAVYGPVVIAANLWTGIGYSNLNIEYKGVACMGELNAEAGLAIFPWFQVQVFGGLQARSIFTNIFDSVTYSPVFGARLVWGSFK